MANRNAPTLIEKSSVNEFNGDAVSSDEDGVWDDGSSNCELNDFDIAVYTQLHRGVFVTAAQKEKFLKDRQSITDQAATKLPQVDAVHRPVATPPTPVQHKPLLSSPQPRDGDRQPDERPFVFSKASAAVQPDNAFKKPNRPSPKIAESVLKVPGYLIGCIIGFRGHRVQDLRASLKVDITIDEKAGRGIGGSRKVTVAGEEKRVVEAVKVLNSYIRREQRFFGQRH